MTQSGAPGRGRRARTIVGPIQHLDPIRLSPGQQSYLRRRRRADVVLGSIGLAITALPMLAISAGVMVTMGRPVLFTKERMTQDGRVFRLRKFRSMRAVAPDGSDDDAARLVPFGRMLRETSLDELPSLWNVVRGDMALVGPRPLTTDYSGRFSAEQFARHTVPAGLTGYAQVHGRNSLAWDDRLTMDQEYVRRVGLVLDLRILVDTVTAVLHRRGVTDEDGVSMADFPG
ncbi:MAG TPA: sugar transferase, partial [Brachybacterium paraconglomeratum]|nr:sugar transferase [Brachybacterium paraconglomeratum]